MKDDIPFENSVTLETFLEKKRCSAALNLATIMTHLERRVPLVQRPYKENSFAQNAFTHEARVAVSTEEGLVVLMKKKNKWTPCDVLLSDTSHNSYHSYQSLCFFQVECIPYLAANFSGGIDIINVDKSETLKIRVRDSYQKTDLLRDTFFIPAKDILASKMVSSHTRKGILCVSLDELLRGSESPALYLPDIADVADVAEVANVANAAKVSNLQNSLNSDMRTYDISEEMHTAVLGERIFCAQGKEVYEFDSEKKKFLSVSSFSAQITSLGTDSSGILYVGTNEGTLFSDGVLRVSFTPKRSIAKIVAGVYEDTQGVYVLQRKNGRYTQISFVPSHSVSHHSFFPRVITSQPECISDFAVSYGICAAVDQNEGLFIKESGGVFEHVTLKQKKIRSIALFGGIYK